VERTLSGTVVDGRAGSRVMSSIASVASAPELKIASAAVAPHTVPLAPEPPPVSAVRIPPARHAAQDGPRDARFDGADHAYAVRQVAQQLAASFAYGAHVSVVSTGTGVHATIDVSA
jgi:hypothetical protein